MTELAPADRRSLAAAFGVVGAVGAGAGTSGEPGSPLTFVLLAYVAAVVLVLAIRGRRVLHAVAWIWGSAVLLLAALVLPIDGFSVPGLAVALLYGTPLWALWTGLAFSLWHLRREASSNLSCRRTDPSQVQGLSHRPSAFAASTSAMPSGRIRPSAVSRSTFAMLMRDHLLRGRRRV